MKKVLLTITTLFLGLFTIASCDIKPKVNPDKVKESETTQPSTDNGEEQPSTEEGVLPGKQNSIPYSQFIGKGENGEDLAFTDFPQLTYLIRYEDALNAHFQKKYEDVIKNKNSEKRFLSKELYEFIKKEKLFIYSFLIFTRENSEGVYTYTIEKQRALIYAYMYYLPQLQSGKITQEEFKEKMHKNFSVFGILFNVEGNIRYIDDDVFSPNDYNEGYVEVGVLKVHYKTFLPKKLTEEEFNKQIQDFIDLFKNLKYGTKDVYFNFD